MKTILVDMDMVLADFEAGRERILRSQFPEMNVIPASELTEFYGAMSYPTPEEQAIVQAVCSEPGFFRNLPVVPGAKEALQEMQNQGLDVQICTSPMGANPNCEAEKREWMAEHFPSITVVHVTKLKHLVPGIILIDDHPSPAEKAGGVASWTHVLKRTPANRKIAHPYIIENWADWAAVLRPLL